MADPKDPKTTLVSQSTPSSDLVEVIKQLAAALKPQGPLEQAGLSPERIAQIKEPPKPQRYREIPWRSEETGATAVAVVVESKKLPNGRITQLKGYTHPPDAYIFQAQEGRVPDGFPMWARGHQVSVPEGQEPQMGDLSPGFRQWRYENFYRADLRRYIGKEIKAHDCQHEDGIRTKWAESRVGAPAEVEQ
jgi:hypothetical protein